jgi:hypothetical protein
MNLCKNSLYKIDWNNISGDLVFEVGGMVVTQFPLAICADTIDGLDSEDLPELVGTLEYGYTTTYEFISESVLWGRKTYRVVCSGDSVAIQMNVAGGGQPLDFIRYGMRRTDGPTLRASVGFSRLYIPRFDWSRGIVHADPLANESLSCQQWLSPPPFFYGWEFGGGWGGVGLEVLPGDYNFLSFDHLGGDSFHLELTYEGHTRVGSDFSTPSLRFFLKPQKQEKLALQHYVDHLVERGLISQAKSEVPSWWREPIFCGWGQQRKDFRKDHDGHENGNWVNAGDYATEIFYRRYLDILQRNGVNPGIVIVDCFWALYASQAKPHPLKWTNMRAFIDEQHASGRKVLLWLTPILTEGLPKEACMSLEEQHVASDPTSPVWRDFFGAEVRKMISSEPQGLNADGFKIDFTQNIPAERGVFRNWLNDRWGIIRMDDEKCFAPLGVGRKEPIQTASSAWGVELIKKYLQVIRTNMKAVKADSLLITHTANPYFAEDVDMLRLNDMDGTSPDVLGIMSHRAAIAKICNPNWLIDTDNDLMINKQMWREYIKLQMVLGNPDTYYATGIAQSGEEFDDDDYELLRTVFQEYREAVGDGMYAGRSFQ